MGTILKFNSRPLENSESSSESDLGEVVIFPGVRYERHDRVKTDHVVRDRVKADGRKRVKPRSGTKKSRATRNRKRVT